MTPGHASTQIHFLFSTQIHLLLSTQKRMRYPASRALGRQCPLPSLHEARVGAGGRRGRVPPTSRGPQASPRPRPAAQPRTPRMCTRAHGPQERHPKVLCAGRAGDRVRHFDKPKQVAGGVKRRSASITPPPPAGAEREAGGGRDGEEGGADTRGSVGRARDSAGSG